MKQKAVFGVENLRSILPLFLFLSSTIELCHFYLEHRVYEKISVASTKQECAEFSNSQLKVMQKITTRRT